MHLGDSFAIDLPPVVYHKEDDWQLFPRLSLLSVATHSLQRNQHSAKNARILSAAQEF